MNRQPWICKTAGTLLCASVVALAGCNSSQPSAPAAPAASGTAAAPAAAPYTPPSADQLYQMVAPIALFPDKLIAQVLAGSTYPDQITSADNVLVQNPNLKGADLQTAIARQPWDPSVKGLTAFPSVLDQMARNIDWTTALGEAYVNDPTDVMNAIQVMRQRASQHGSLRSSAQMSVVTQAAPAQPVDDAGDDDNGYPVYNGPAVVPAPEQIIEIQPAQPDTVYVPQYDAQTVYGEEVASYPGYVYERPREYSTGQMVTVGAVSFGVGVLVGALFEHHHDEARSDYGWQSWGMNWGSRRRDGERGDNGGWQRPAVVHNNTTYISRSTTVVNRYATNNINNSHNVVYNHSNVNSNNQHNTTISNNQHNDNRRTDNHREPNAPALAASPTGTRPAIARTPALAGHKPMSMPDFGARSGHVAAPRNDAIATRHPVPSARPVAMPARGHLQPMPRVGNSHAVESNPAAAPVVRREVPARTTEPPRTTPEAPRSMPRTPQRPAPAMKHPHPAVQPFRAAPKPESTRPAVREQAQPVRHENAHQAAHPQQQRKAEPRKKADKKDERDH